MHQGVCCFPEQFLTQETGSSTSLSDLTDVWFWFFFLSLCIFCGERDESFTEDGLDLHYWKHCPMLTRCEHCKQVRLL